MEKIKPGFLFLLVILGVLLSLQFKVINTGIKYVKVQDLYLLKNEISRDQGEILQLESKITETNETLKKYQNGSYDKETVEDALKEELVKQKTLLGLTDVHGPGVIVLITDSTRELEDNEDPNNLIVHDFDIKKIVDDLIASGAEAVSINDERVVTSKRDIVCNGPTIRINDKLVAQPFIIKAIGDKNFLEASIKAPGRYGNLLEEWGLYVEVNASVNVQIPAYNGVLEYKNVTLLEEND